jgi:hypothetical protein
MTIANELSSDIAAALVAAKDKHPDQLRDLKQILLEVHRTLQQLKQKTRNERLFAKFGGKNSERC